MAQPRRTLLGDVSTLLEILGQVSGCERAWAVTLVAVSTLLEILI